MGQWVSWPIKGGSATSIFWKSGTVHWPRSLLNPDELTLLKLPHSVGQPIWSSIQWTIHPCTMGRLKSFGSPNNADQPHLPKHDQGQLKLYPGSWITLSAWAQMRPAQFFPFHETAFIYSIFPAFFFLWSPAQVLHGLALPLEYSVIVAKTVH